MVPLDSDRITRVPPYLGNVLAYSTFMYWTITIYGQAFQLVPLAVQVRYEHSHNPRQKNPTGLGSTGVARHYCRYVN